MFLYFAVNNDYKFSSNNNKTTLIRNVQKAKLKNLHKYKIRVKMAGT